MPPGASIGSLGSSARHGTSTPVGDTKELQAVKEVFTDTSPIITSTKSLSGHALGAAGSNEAIYSLIMMESDFIAGSANIHNIVPVLLTHIPAVYAARYCVCMWTVLYRKKVASYSSGGAGVCCMVV